jgi:hypothetical protein
VFSGVSLLFKRDVEGPGDCWSGVCIVEVDEVGDKGSGDTTVVNLGTVLEAFLENFWTLGLFS